MLTHHWNNIGSTACFCWQGFRSNARKETCSRESNNLMDSSCCALWIIIRVHWEGILILLATACRQDKRDTSAKNWFNAGTGYLTLAQHWTSLVWWASLTGELYQVGVMYSFGDFQFGLIMWFRDLVGAGPELDRRFTLFMFGISM